MPKILKTAPEIAAMIMKEAAKIPECEGLTGVTIQALDDDRVPYNWTVSHLHNSPGRYCEVAIETMVEGMQLVIDLQH